MFVRFFSRRGSRFVWTMLAEGAPIPVLGALLSIVPWRTLNTHLTIKESREEDELKAEQKREEREEKEDDREEEREIAQAFAEGKASEEERAQFEMLTAENKSLRDARFKEYLDHMEGATRDGAIAAHSGIRSFADMQGFDTQKRPSELARELEPRTGVSDANRRAIGALNAIDSTNRPSVSDRAASNQPFDSRFKDKVTDVANKARQPLPVTDFSDVQDARFRDKVADVADKARQKN